MRAGPLGEVGAEPAVRPVAAPHARGPGELARELGTDPERGLCQEVAAARLADVGPNRLPAAERPPYLAIALRQVGPFRSIRVSSRRGDADLSVRSASRGARRLMEYRNVVNASAPR